MNTEAVAARKMNGISFTRMVPNFCRATKRENSESNGKCDRKKSATIAGQFRSQDLLFACATQGHHTMALSTPP